MRFGNQLLKQSQCSHAISSCSKGREKAKLQGKTAREGVQDTRSQPSQSKRKPAENSLKHRCGRWCTVCVFPEALLTATPRQAELGAHVASSAVQGDTTHCVTPIDITGRILAFFVGTCASGGRTGLASGIARFVEVHCFTSTTSRL